MANDRSKPTLGKLLEALAKKFAEKLSDAVAPAPEPRPVPIPVRATRRR